MLLRKCKAIACRLFCKGTVLLFIHTLVWVPPGLLIPAAKYSPPSSPHTPVCFFGCASPSSTQVFCLFVCFSSILEFGSRSQFVLFPAAPPALQFCAYLLVQGRPWHIVSGFSLLLSQICVLPSDLSAAVQSLAILPLAIIVPSQAVSHMSSHNWGSAFPYRLGSWSRMASATCHRQMSLSS